MLEIFLTYSSNLSSYIVCTFVYKRRGDRILRKFEKGCGQKKEGCGLKKEGDFKRGWVYFLFHLFLDEISSIAKTTIVKGIVVDI